MDAGASRHAGGMSRSQDQPGGPLLEAGAAARSLPAGQGAAACYPSRVHSQRFAPRPTLTFRHMETVELLQTPTL